MTLLALAAALAAMLANTAATLLEALGSRRATPDRPVWRQPAYLVGLALDGLGWVLAVLALRTLPVFAVQSVLTSSVAVTTLASHRFDVRRLPRAQLAGVVGVVVGLVLVAGSAATGRAPALPAAAVPVLVAAALVLVAVALPVARSGRPFVTAAVAGAAYGGAALSVRALHTTAALASDLTLLAHPLTYAVVVFGAVGVVLVAAALRHGAPGPVTAVLSVTEILLPGAAGLVLLGDAVRPGWEPALAVGVVAVVGSVVLLARAEQPSRRVPA
ncbi:hypothetical protein WDZ17_09870 [Pseudokineococcus basanitobsidens]|uniref:Magnesium transporter NIPA n=1 Tax=Pseudokineococcus basanitobsidens TaxID=1926649 RepID=A0ABU8RKH0_9ACTN